VGLDRKAKEDTLGVERKIYKRIGVSSTGFR